MRAFKISLLLFVLACWGSAYAAIANADDVDWHSMDDAAKDSIFECQRSDDPLGCRRRLMRTLNEQKEEQEAARRRARAAADCYDAEANAADLRVIIVEQEAEIRRLKAEIRRLKAKRTPPSVDMSGCRGNMC